MFLQKIKRIKDYQFDKYFNNFWYNSLYTDVRESKLGYRYHYELYGKKENRIKNLKVFLQTSKYQNTKYRDLILRIIFYLLSLKRSNTFSATFLNLIALIEFSKLKKYKFNSIIVTSWLEGGVAEAVKLYSQKLSNNSNIAILRGLKHSDGSDLKPMVLEIVNDSIVIDRIPLINPLNSIKLYNSKVSCIEQIHIHHFFEIEFFVHTLLRTLSSKFFVYIHDYYLFTTKFHLFDDTYGRLDLQIAHQEHPNELINLQSLFDRVDVFICPSENTYIRISKLIHTNKLRWIYPPEDPNIETLSVKKIGVKEHYSICIIGNMGVYKGSEIITRLIKTIKQKKLPYKLFHFGLNPVMQNNEYYYNFSNLARSEMLSKISTLDLDLALLPFQAEESYSFALSDVFKLNLPLISTKVGAIPERCMGRDLTILLDPSSEIDLMLKSISDLILGNIVSHRSNIPKNIQLARNRVVLLPSKLK